MAAEGHAYTGFLYAGLMIDAGGAPKVIEFNCRFGDPETQPILLRLQSSLPELVEQALAGRLDTAIAEWDPRPALGIVLAAGGYPGDVRKGDPITGLDNAEPDAKLFHAGTTLRDGTVVTNGGRVLCATAMGKTVAAAQQAAYRLAGSVNWEGVFMRNDIGWRAIQREQE
jgi:phosphoribosylamine--glycine ligase